MFFFLYYKSFNEISIDSIKKKTMGDIMGKKSNGKLTTGWSINFVDDIYTFISQYDPHSKRKKNTHKNKNMCFTHIHLDYPILFHRCYTLTFSNNKKKSVFFLAIILSIRKIVGSSIKN